MIQVPRNQAPGDRVVIAPEGELDAQTAADLRAALNQASPGRPVVVDLSRVTFIDSDGIGALIGGIRQIRANRGSVTVLCNRPGLLQVIRSCGLGALATITTSVPDRQ